MNPDPNTAETPETDECDCGHSQIGHIEGCASLTTDWKARAEELQQQLTDIEDWNEAACPMGFDEFTDKAMNLIRNRREKMELVSLISAQLRELSASQAEARRLKWLIGQVLGDLPEKRDWLNPDIEREMKALAPADGKGGTQTVTGISGEYGSNLSIQTGDMDDPCNHRFVIGIGGNGDIYLQVTPQDKRYSPAVHIVTHGGHSSKMPGVTNALFVLYRAMWDHRDGKGGEG